ncbi:hypothetical protein [Bacillus sp. RS11]
MNRLCAKACRCFLCESVAAAKGFYLRESDAAAADVWTPTEK